ncbi:MAG: hypothetical protein ACREOW_13380 [Thermodesulfobacteriota bacterium]
MDYSEIILLFDEQSTPTFRADRESDAFLGVCLLYESRNEESIFERCSELAGLKNIKPLKNRKTSISRGIELAEVLSELPIQISVSLVNLSNKRFQKVAIKYEEFGNRARKLHRSVRERPIAQILHSPICDRCLYDSMINLIDLNPQNYIFYPWIDNWSISKSGIRIVLEKSSESLEQKINSYNEEFRLNSIIRVLPIKLLEKDTSRKRLIDAVASIVGRAFFKEYNERYSPKALNILKGKLGNRFNFFDITEEETNFMIKFMTKYRDK